MEHSKHIIRAVLLLVMSIVVFVVVRHFIIPKSFGAYGHFRADNIAEIAGRSPVHGAPAACAECHADEADFVSEGRHASISCEVCHAPLSTHAIGGERIAEMVVRPTNELCAWCHQRLAARPATFPQVNFLDHVTDKGGELVQGICLECHDAHDPME